MLRSSVHGALEQVGLDPYLGYLHGIRPAKPALALDLMEKFRPLLVDRLVLTLANRDQIKTTHTMAHPTNRGVIARPTPRQCRRSGSRASKE
ncbi:CRISPR-associated endonuclease Cas1 [Nocardia sp. NEAU-G5]|uniref:CRISPR-associated endonuclease Cas1 n=1 Tax=Nocardia albiluteola TaxID=2842303 RepID=A0ABS6B6Q7_9NOCA|nr:CRISPR-associated endonuclease Cas1 [Nocardia albiluteola]